jgi:hypothetical protein
MSDESAEMNDLEVAWRRANDDDVTAALRSLCDYPPIAVDTIQREARRRGIGIVGELVPKRERHLNDWAVLSGSWVVGHPIVVAIITTGALRLGVGAASASLSITSPWLPSAVFIPSWIGILGFLACSTRSYRKTVWIALAGTVAPTVVGFAHSFLAGALPFSSSWSWLVFPIVAVAVWWLLAWPLLCLAVRIYTRRYPQRCGYDLRGLPQPRCPECGTPFVQSNAGSPTANPGSHEE